MYAVVLAITAKDMERPQQERDNCLNMTTRHTVRSALIVDIRDIQATNRTDPDWLNDPNEDNDEESSMGFNEPDHWEPGDQELSDD